MAQAACRMQLGHGQGEAISKPKKTRQRKFRKKKAKLNINIADGIVQKTINFTIVVGIV